ncbi:unnamed protein product, partial [Rotaria magnacalcarata]
MNNNDLNINEAQYQGNTLLKIDPGQRPTIHTLVENIEDLAIGNDIGLNEPLLFLFNTNDTITS